MIQTHTTHRLAGPEADDQAPATIFLEIPHGATTHAHLEAIKTLDAQTPEDWDTVYWCSTDQGAPEVALRAAQLLTSPEWAWAQLGQAAAQQAADRVVVLIRGLIPRHYVDLNRLWVPQDQTAGVGLTPTLPEFLRQQPEPGRKLQALHTRYHAAIMAQYEQTCGLGGQAMQIHTYSPRSVSAPQGVSGPLLRRAWSDAEREQWPLRPIGQLITGRADEPPLSDAALVDALRREFEAIGVTLAVNEPFAFHPVTTLDQLAHRWPGQLTALELGREFLAQRYDPLGPWTPDVQVVERAAGALARALATRMADAA